MVVRQVETRDREPEDQERERSVAQSDARGVSQVVEVVLIGVVRLLCGI